MANAMLDFVRAFPQGDMAGGGAALEQMGFTAELSPQQFLEVHFLPSQMSTSSSAGTARLTA